MRGFDHLPRTAASLIVTYRATPFEILIGRQALAHFPFAELKPVLQDKPKGLRGTAAGIARQLLQPALLRGTEHKGSHSDRSNVSPRIVASMQRMAIDEELPGKRYTLPAWQNC
jgi:hypothetical protein